MKKGVDRRRRITRALTADLHDLRYDPLYDRLAQILSALPVIESRRDTVGAEANICVIHPTWVSTRTTVQTITKQVERELLALGSRSMHSASTSAR